MALNPESGVRQQDARSVIANIASNPYGRDLAFDFVRNNWKNITE